MVLPFCEDKDKTVKGSHASFANNLRTWSKLRKLIHKQLLYRNFVRLLFFRQLTVSGIPTSSISQDNNTNFNEVFGVTLTNVQLVNNSYPNSKYNPPSVDALSRNIQVVIAESVKSNGVISFNSTWQPISVNESIETLRIPVYRTNGTGNAVGAYYRILFHNASEEDVNPIEGVVYFGNGVSTSEIVLSIVNDDEPELREMFIVEITKPVGGALIGSPNNLDVFIEQNDHPYGLFM